MDNNCTKQNVQFTGNERNIKQDNLILFLTHKTARNAKFPWIMWEGEVGIFMPY